MTHVSCTRVLLQLIKYWCDELLSMLMIVAVAVIVMVVVVLIFC